MFPDIQERFLKFLVHEKGLKNESAQAYLEYIHYLYLRSGDILKTCLKYRDVANGIVSLKEERKWSDRTTYKVASMTAVFFNWAAREGLIQESPMRLGHQFKRSESKQIDFFDWDSEDFKKMIHNPNNTIRVTVILHVLKSSGIRASELCHLKISDIENRWLRIRQGKGSRDRYAPIDDETHHWLEIYLDYLKTQHYSQEWLFPHEDLMGHITTSGLYKIIHRLGQKVGVKAYPHKFRHSLAGQLISNGADITIAAEVLGHKTLSSTKIYTHFKKEKTLELYDKFLKRA